MKVHKNCGGEIEEIILDTFNLILLKCKKCGKVLTGCILHQIEEQSTTSE